jgi:hypothetical protein
LAANAADAEAQQTNSMAAAVAARNLEIIVCEDAVIGLAAMVSMLAPKSNGTNVANMLGVAQAENEGFWTSVRGAQIPA